MPKIMIEISDDDYTKILTYHPGCKVRLDADAFMRTMQNGIFIPDNPTNGDVFKAVFRPSIENERCCGGVILNEIVDSEYILGVGKDWWNSPYKRGAIDVSNN